MVAFVVSVNGRRLCCFGVGSSGVLGAHVSWFMRPGQTGNGDLRVGGLDTAASEHVEWIGPVEVQVGDTVTIQVVEVDIVDPPTDRYRALR
jgi:hypothetical protein